MSNADFQPKGKKPTLRLPETRSETVRRERRYRGDTSEMGDLKLAVPEHLKKPDHAYRWVNDTVGGRVAAMYKKDWDVVADTAIPGTGEGTPVKRSVEQHAPLNAVLMEKPLDWYENDRRGKNASRLEIEATMMRGALPSKDGLQPNESYVPQGHTNRIIRDS